MSEPAQQVPAATDLPEWLVIANNKTDRLRLGVQQFSVAIGEALLRGKKACKHGEFMKWMDGHYIGGRFMASKFMAIAENPVTANCLHANNLPPDVTTLGNLAQIPAPALEPMLGKEVTKDLERDKAAILVRRWKLKQKARSEAIKRHKKGLAPKPPALTGDAAKDEKAKRAEARAEKLELIDRIPEETIRDLGLIAIRENDLAEFASYTPEYQEKILTATRGGIHNTLKAARQWVDATTTGTVTAGPSRDTVPSRVVVAIVQLPDILNPVMSLLGQLHTIANAMTKRWDLYSNVDPATWGRAPKLLLDLVASLDQQKKALSFQIPYMVCDQCHGSGVNESDRACPACRSDLASPTSPGWVCMATYKKRQADQQVTDRMRGE